jgi:hypothetical protein
MKSHTASYSIQYSVRNGALERILRPGARAKQRVPCRVTGIRRLAPRTQFVPSFYGLLGAYGITQELVTLQVTEAGRHQIADHE